MNNIRVTKALALILLGLGALILPYAYNRWSFLDGVAEKRRHIQVLVDQGELNSAYESSEQLRKILEATGHPFVSDLETSVERYRTLVIGPLIALKGYEEPFSECQGQFDVATINDVIDRIEEWLGDRSDPSNATAPGQAATIESDGLNAQEHIQAQLECIEALESKIGQAPKGAVAGKYESFSERVYIHLKGVQEKQNHIRQLQERKAHLEKSHKLLQEIMNARVTIENGPSDSGFESFKSLRAHIEKASFDDSRIIWNTAVRYFLTTVSRRQKELFERYEVPRIEKNFLRYLAEKEHSFYMQTIFLMGFAEPAMRTDDPQKVKDFEKTLGERASKMLDDPPVDINIIPLFSVIRKCAYETIDLAYQRAKYDRKSPLEKALCLVEPDRPYCREPETPHCSVSKAEAAEEELRKSIVERERREIDRELMTLARSPF